MAERAKRCRNNIYFKYNIVYNKELLISNYWFRCLKPNHFIHNICQYNCFRPSRKTVNGFVIEAKLKSSETSVYVAEWAKRCQNNIYFKYNICTKRGIVNRSDAVLNIINVSITYMWPSCYAPRLYIYILYTLCNELCVCVFAKHIFVHNIIIYLRHMFSFTWLLKKKNRLLPSCVYITWYVFLLQQNITFRHVHILCNICLLQQNVTFRLFSSHAHLSVPEHCFSLVFVTWIFISTRALHFVRFRYTHISYIYICCSKKPNCNFLRLNNKLNKTHRQLRKTNIYILDRWNGLCELYCTF